jgi:hypothetical protein
LQADAERLGWLLEDLGRHPQDVEIEHYEGDYESIYDALDAAMKKSRAARRARWEKEPSTTASRSPAHD